MQTIHNPVKSTNYKYYREKGRSPEVGGHWECPSQKKESEGQAVRKGRAWAGKRVEEKKTHRSIVC